MTTISNSLVSVITPCYNGGKCVHRLFDSVIGQTYRPIEFILVNDGSTDNTLQVVEEYRPKFQEAGIAFQCVTQENRGVSGAINTGLKLFTGEYLCWLDADDYLEPTSIEERVKAFQEHPEVAVVTSDAYARRCESLDCVDSLVADDFPHSAERHQFEYMLKEKSIVYSGCNMVKTSCFLEVNPERHIFDCRWGQNWQMLLPLYFKYERFYLDKPLYNYIVSSNSLERGERTMENLVQRYTGRREILLATLRMIQEVQHADMSGYLSYVEKKYARMFMELAIRYEDRDYFVKLYEEKKRTQGVGGHDYLANLRSRFPLLNRLKRNIRKMIRGK